MSDRERIVDLDRRFLWRPYTSSEDHEAMDPLVIVGAEGAWLFDADGRRYLDGNASWWTCNVGHGHRRLRAALRRQSESLMHCAFAGITHEPAVELARELIEVAPAGLERVFYSDDGSTSVEVALKMAFQFWQQNGRPERVQFVALSSAFHGDTVGAMSVSGMGQFRGVFAPILFEVIRAPEPGEDWESAVASVERKLEAHSDEIAGVLVEPLLQGAAGMRSWPAPLLGRLREATRRADTFLIADEVFTGFGRTGAMWACDHAGVTPDILCTAKGLSGGVLPFAATLATDRVYGGFRGDKSRALMHGHTFFGNPLGASVAREVLAIYRDECVVEQAARKAPTIAAAFRSIATLRGVRRSRAFGMTGAADLGAEGYMGRLGWHVYEAARRRGAYVRPLGDTVYVAPPLTIPDSDLGQLLAIVHDSIAEVLTA